MIIVMKPNAGKRDIENIVEKLHEHGLEAHLSTGKQVTIIGVIGDKGLLSDSNMELMPGVDKLVPITESYKLVNKKFNAKRTVVNINGIEIGGDHFTLIRRTSCCGKRRANISNSFKAQRKRCEDIKGWSLQTQDISLFISRHGSGRPAIHEKCR